MRIKGKMTPISCRNARQFLHYKSQSRISRNMQGLWTHNGQPCNIHIKPCTYNVAGCRFITLDAKINEKRELDSIHFYTLLFWRRYINLKPIAKTSSARDVSGARMFFLSGALRFFCIQLIQENMVRGILPGFLQKCFFLHLCLRARPR